MSDVIPTSTSRDSDHLFETMTRVTLDLVGPGDDRRILDVASGMGQDADALAARGSWVVGVEPSERMCGWVRLRRADAAAGASGFVRGWADALPFASGSFDGAICKGAIDHFDRPWRAIAEMARVVRPSGRVVLAIANFESLSCRTGRWGDAIRERWLHRPVRRGRRHYDVPSDHFTRYELELMREQASAFLDLEVVWGVSLAWGIAAWSRLLEQLPSAAARAALQTLDGLARRTPSLADVVVLAGRPRRAAAPRSSRTSA